MFPLISGCWANLLAFPSHSTLLRSSHVSQQHFQTIHTSSHGFRHLQVTTHVICTHPHFLILPFCSSVLDSGPDAKRSRCSDIRRPCFVIPRPGSSGLLFFTNNPLHTRTWFTHMFPTPAPNTFFFLNARTSVLVAGLSLPGDPF